MIPSTTGTGEMQWFCLGPLALMGVGHAVFTVVIWSCIPYTVPKHLVGTAFGVTTVVQNIGLTVSPFIAAACLDIDPDYGWTWLMMFFCLLCVIGIVVIMWLYYNDINNKGGVLSAPIY